MARGVVSVKQKTPEKSYTHSNIKYTNKQIKTTTKTLLTLPSCRGAGIPAPGGGGEPKDIYAAPTGEGGGGIDVLGPTWEGCGGGAGRGADCAIGAGDDKR